MLFRSRSYQPQEGGRIANIFEPQFSRAKRQYALNARRADDRELDLRKPFQEVNAGASKEARGAREQHVHAALIQVPKVGRQGGFNGTNYRERNISHGARP